SSYAVAALRPLSPEQLAWSVMQATGLTDAERQALGPKGTEAALYARLAGNVAPFVATFGGQPGQPEGQGFEARLDRTRFLKTAAWLRGWLAPGPGNLADRLAKLKDVQAVAEELYLSVLTRLPGAEERKEVADYLAARPAGLEDLVWALVSSAEFR